MSIFLKKEIEQLKCAIRKLLCCNCSCDDGGTIGPPKKTVKLTLGSSFCCNYEDSVRLEIPNNCCSNPSFYLQFYQNCCENTNPRVLLNMLTRCCTPNNVSIEIGNPCCDNLVVISMTSPCCENRTLELDLLEECCQDSDTIVILNLTTNCCENGGGIAVI